MTGVCFLAPASTRRCAGVQPYFCLLLHRACDNHCSQQAVEYMTMLVTLAWRRWKLDFWRLCGLRRKCEASVSGAKRRETIRSRSLPGHGRRRLPASSRTSTGTDGRAVAPKSAPATRPDTIPVEWVFCSDMIAPVFPEDEDCTCTTKSLSPPENESTYECRMLNARIRFSE